MRYVYYDLVQVTWKDGMVGHIPVPILADGKEELSLWDAKHSILMRMFFEAEERDLQTRGNDFFICVCGEESFFENECDACWVGYEKPNLAIRKENIIRAFRRGFGLPQTVSDMIYIRTEK